MQQSVFTRPNIKGKAATIASRCISQDHGKHKKSFEASKLVKEAFVEAALALLANFQDKAEIIAAIKNVHLSRNTVTQQHMGMAVYAEQQLKNDTKASECSSLFF